MDEYTKAKLADPTSVAIVDSSIQPPEEETDEEVEGQSKSAKTAEAKDAKKD